MFEWNVKFVNSVSCNDYTFLIVTISHCDNAVLGVLSDYRVIFCVGTCIHECTRKAHAPYFLTKYHIISLCIWDFRSAISRQFIVYTPTRCDINNGLALTFHVYHLWTCLIYEPPPQLLLASFDNWLISWQW